MRALDAELERAHGLRLVDYDVLIHLARSPDRRLRMAELAEAVLLTRSGLTRLVDRLEQRGLVERRKCANDARGAFAVLTDEGLRRFREAHPTHVAGVRRLFLDVLSRDDLRRLAAVWERVEAALAADAG
jgi:DNA-binding MarR family transcriptional regulator